jgi:hypothetical protein
VKDLRTPYGLLSYTLKREGAGVVWQVAAGLQVPPGGVVLIWPGRERPSRDTRVNGQVASWQGGELRVDELPAKVVINE